jgi:type IV pilus assembly protein PilX
MNRHSFSHGVTDPRNERGVALVVALVLLIVATMIGLAGIRVSAVQQRLSANMFDRSLAMQASEAALRAAEAAITANPGVGVDCSPPSGNLCEPIPPSAFSAAGADWITVPAAFVTNPALSASPPQFMVQFLGEGTVDDELGLGSSANLAQYGAGGGVPVARFFRVIARSHDPTADGVEDRAIVVLTTTVRRAI